MKKRTDPINWGKWKDYRLQERVFPGMLLKHEISGAIFKVLKVKNDLIETILIDSGNLKKKPGLRSKINMNKIDELFIAGR